MRKNIDLASCIFFVVLDVLMTWRTISLQSEQTQSSVPSSESLLVRVAWDEAVSGLK